MKEFIKDNGRIRNCASNIAKMNWIDYNFKLYSWKSFFFPVAPPKLKEVTHILAFISQIIPLWWIVSIFNANSEIKRHKKEIERNRVMRKG